MKSLKKLLITFVITAIFCGNFTAAAYAQGTEATTGTQTKEADVATDAEQEEPNSDESLITDTSAAEDTDSEKKTEKNKEKNKEKESEVEVVIEDVVEEEEVTEKANYSKSDLRLLACLIYAEAGNQSYDAMLGVANVVLNRVKSDAYWHVDTIKEVIYDDKWSVQFAVTKKNSKGVSPMDKALKAYDTNKFTGGNPEAEKKCMKRAIKAAKAALNGENNIGSYLCFSNKGYKSYVKKHYSDYKIIDDLIFFRSK